MTYQMPWSIRDERVENRGHRWRYIASHAIPPASLLLGGIAAAVASGCHVSLNDFWGNVVLAQYADPGRPATWYSGFFPFGYHLLIRLLALDEPVPFGHAMSLAGGVLAVWVVARTTSRQAGFLWGVAIGLALAAEPMFFRYVTTPGADLPGVGLATLGVGVLAAASHHKGASWTPALAGMSLALAFLFRQHFAIVMFGSLIAWTIFVRDSKRALQAWIPPVMAVVAQAGVNLSAGHGPFETSQSLSVARAMYGLEWHELTSTSVKPEMRSLILGDPWRFAATYLDAAAGLAPYCVPALAAAVVHRRNPALFRTSLLLAGAQLFYVVVVSLGASSRAVLPLLPLAAMSLALAIVPLRRLRIQPRSARILAAAAIAIPAGLWFARSVIVDVRLVARRAATQAELSLVESTLRSAGVTSPKQVFATDLSFFLPDMPPHIPYANGGWYRVDVPPYDRQYPPLCARDPACLVDDARRRGVRAIVIPSWGLPPSRELASAAWPSDVAELPAPAGWRVIGIAER